MTARFHETSANHKIFNSILIIEPDKIQRKGLAIALMDLFSVIEMTIEPVDAIKLAANKNFDVILAEVDLEKNSELEGLKTLKKLNPDAKLIIICNEIIDEVKEELENIQIYKFFERPYSIKALIVEIEQLKKQNTHNKNSINSK